MRLLISSGLFYPAKLGGPANTLYWLAKSLVRQNIDVSVITTNNVIDADWVVTDRWQIVDGIKVRYCSFNGGIMRMLWHSWIELSTCDIVMLCDLFQRQVLLTALMARAKGKRIIWSPRGELFPLESKPNCLKRLYLFLIKYLLGYYALFHATSLEEETLIKKYIGRSVKTCVIPNYIELPNLYIRNNVSPQYMLYVGRIAPIKALDILIDGLAQSKLFRHSKYVFKIAGGVEEQFQHYFKQLVSKIESYGLESKVEFVGTIHGDEKYQIYANAFAFFLMSHSENFGNVVIESLSQGTPVIASKGTPWNILQSTQAGYWIKNTSEEIACYIDKILSMGNSEYNKMRIAARQLASQYDVDYNIINWIRILN